MKPLLESSPAGFYRVRRGQDRLPCGWARSERRPGKPPGGAKRPRDEPGLRHRAGPHVTTLPAARAGGGARSESRGLVRCRAVRTPRWRPATTTASLTAPPGRSTGNGAAPQLRPAALLGAGLGGGRWVRGAAASRAGKPGARLTRPCRAPVAPRPPAPLPASSSEPGRGARFLLPARCLRGSTCRRPPPASFPVPRVPSVPRRDASVPAAAGAPGFFRTEAGGYTCRIPSSPSSLESGFRCLRHAPAPSVRRSSPCLPRLAAYEDLLPCSSWISLPSTTSPPKESSVSARERTLAAVILPFPGFPRAACFIAFLNDVSLPYSPPSHCTRHLLLFTSFFFLGCSLLYLLHFLGVLYVLPSTPFASLLFLVRSIFSKASITVGCCLFR